MLGNKLLNKTTVKVSEEALKQQKLVIEEIGKLADLTNRGWDLVASELFDKVRKISFGEGFICGTAFAGLTVAASKVVKKRKSKTDEKE